MRPGERLEPYDLEQLEGEIMDHERGADFLDWIAERPEVIDWSAGIVRQKVEQSRAPVGPGYLIERLRYDYPGDLGDGVPKINQSWAPLLARLVMIEYPELNGAVRINPSSEDEEEEA